MTTELNHILMAASLLIVAGIASFPYRLNYGNTAWLPRWMRPDRSYLDRPWEYDYPARGIGLKEMYPESFNLLAFTPLAALSTVSLWWNTTVCIILFGILLLCLTAARYVCRFHPVIKGDEHERRGYLRYWRRN